MIKSMTGYGRRQQLTSGYDITVEIKSVNHRYFEFFSRLPRAYGYLEDNLKTLVHGLVTRGKVDIYVSITAVETADTIVEIDQPLAQSYLEELRKLSGSLGLEDDIKLSHIARFNDIYTLRRRNDQEELIWQLTQQVAVVALARLDDMRKAEGQKMKEDILSRIQLIEDYVTTIEKNSPLVVSQWQERLYHKITQVLEDKQVDEARLLTEVAIFAEKTAVDEETVRLHSHFAQFRSILDEPGAVGRKLDFLVQEINRETNTIGSKCSDIDVCKLVVEIKSETEKIREQIQNIE